MRELRLLEEIGVGLFECSRNDEQVSGGHVPTSADMIDELRQRPAEPAKGDVPWPLIPLLGDHLDAVQWTEIEPGISTAAIELTANAKGDLRLLRLDAGRRLPEHGHVGEELSLVLRGSYSDEHGTFGVGDLSDLDDETRHSMLAGDEGCIVLIASETEPEFLSALTRRAA